MKTFRWTFVTILVLSLGLLLSMCVTKEPDDQPINLSTPEKTKEVGTPSATLTATETEVPTMTPTITNTPWVWPTALYEDSFYGHPKMVGPIVEAWNDNVSVYVLLGSDYAEWRKEEATGTDNTDLFIIVIVKKKPALVSMISVPRDLYVFLPGFGMQRINTAWKNGGPEMIADVLRYNFGLPMNGYAYVRMEAFAAFIDNVLHGVNVQVRKQVVDHCGDIRINLLPATHFMDGETVLCYTRVRMFDGGFARQTRQREVLQAMKQRVLEIAGDDMLGTIQEIFKLYASEHRYTDLDILDVIELIPVALEANENNMVLEYQMDYSIGLDQFTHPESGAWLLAPPSASCTYTLIWSAVMGEPWAFIPDEICPEWE